MLGIWMAFGAYDDGYYIASADLSDPSIYPEYFFTPQYELIKNQSYTLFHQAVNFSGLSYPIVVSLVWTAAALLAIRTFKRLSKNRVFLVFLYLFILFTPSAFDIQTGTRLYRNAILAPFVLITFLLMLDVYFRLIKTPDIKAKKLIAVSIVLGLVFSFSYYIKEDGVWLLACLICCIFIYAAMIICHYLKNRKEKPSAGVKRIASKIIVLCLPVLIFAVLTHVYKSYNYENYGIYEVNSRTEGELARYVDLVYKIYSPNRNEKTWAPADAIDKSYEVSETFQQYPQLIDNIRHTGWFSGDIYNDPINGDFLTWVLRTSLYDVGLWTDDGAVNAMFKPINDEIEQALESGQIQKDERFQLVSSAPGRTSEELEELIPLIEGEFNIHINLEGYIPGGHIEQDDEFPEVYKLADDITNFDIYHPSEYIRNLKQEALEPWNEAAQIIFNIYSVINPVLITAVICGTICNLIYLIIKRIKKSTAENKFLLPVLVISLLLMLLSLFYALGIAWFSSFLSVGMVNLAVLKFYGIGLVPLLTILEIFGAYYLTLFVKYLIKKFHKPYAEQGADNI